MKKFKNLFILTALALTLLGCFCLSSCQKPSNETITVYVEEKIATCTEDGNIGYWKDGNGNIFFDEAGTKSMDKDSVIIPSGHEWVFFSDESSHWSECDRCNEKRPPEPHTFSQVERVSANFSKAGHSAGIQCSECEYMSAGTVTPARTPFTQRKYGNLNYCLYRPENAKESEEKLPLILFLHGVGERGNDNSRQLNLAIRNVVSRESTSKFMNAVVIAPQCPRDTTWINYGFENGNYTLAEVDESNLLKQVIQLVNVYKNYSYIDENRIYVMGISMGGFAAWDLLARHSNLFAAGVPICGGGAIDAVQTLKDIPVFTFHGALDTLVPYEKTTPSLVNAIKAAGGNKIRFVTFSDEGHDCWDSAVLYEGDENNPSLESWLFAQSR